jgi:serine/threonine protein kinase
MTTTRTDRRAQAGVGFVHARAGERFGADGRYTLLRLLGTGGMASVWVADDARTGREVALKVLSDSLALDPAFVARFHREARLAAGLSHPNVVAVLDQDTGAGRPYLVMEYVPGGTVADRIAEGGLDRWDLRALAIDLLRTLDYLHGVGVLHRDLKPANVLLGTDGRIRLTDFGVASLTDGTRVTGTGELIGTQRYLAPEVLAGHAADERSDLYACGVLLAECAGPDVPEPLAGLIRRLGQVDPARRPASAGAALALLTPGLDPTAPIPAPRVDAVPTLPVEAGLRPDSNGAPSVRFVAAVTAAVVLATGAVVLSGAGRAEPAPPVPAAPAEVGLLQQLDLLERAVVEVGR